MSKISDNTITNQIVQVAREFGYEAIREPVSPPFRIFGWFRGRRFGPDIVVRHDNRSAIVVAKSRPAVMYDVFITDQLRGKKDTGALICVSDASFRRIRDSATDYALELDVRLCSLSGVGDILRELLDSPDRWAPEETYD